MYATANKCIPYILLVHKSYVFHIHFTYYVFRYGVTYIDFAETFSNHPHIIKVVKQTVIKL